MEVQTRGTPQTPASDAGLATAATMHPTEPSQAAQLMASSHTSVTLARVHCGTMSAWCTT